MAVLSSSSRGSSEQQEVVLITGCTKGGLGHALALAFAKSGCIVVATARSLASMEDIDKAHPNIQTLLQLDVASAESRDAAVAAALQRHGRIDILVNNAGMHCIAPIAELPLSLLQNAFTTNVFAPICLIQAVLPQMIARRAGKIVNIGSVAGYSSGPWAGGYSASKAALHALSDSLRVELTPFGVDVVVVAPGAIKSNIEVNAAQVYNGLPKWKFYQPWEQFIKKRMSYSQQAGSTSSEEFAEKTVKEVLRKNPPHYLAVGYLSTKLTLLYYLPVFLRDFVYRRMFGLKEVPSSKSD
ncbi:hypothetical protein GOP47_0002840 [Adiantum capillus-veneris]|uniref:NADPH-dependent 1-acyldihydroxyacetone phosphate reductase n=1 Tax=Adiantum capillus-veneris TaxID=13818 RepID=A0A9D4VCU0_ADICA|nr:hypothetical protein GOP47_0002840 [Adiantum capillus-veneris]